MKPNAFGVAVGGGSPYTAGQLLVVEHEDGPGGLVRPSLKSLCLRRALHLLANGLKKRRRGNFRLIRFHLDDDLKLRRRLPVLEYEAGSF